MFTAVRSRITPTSLVAVAALVFAMSGGAYAAGHFLITSTKQISPKVLKALKGKPGANGASGANGATGPAGAAGGAGPAGGTGPQGPQGPQGPAGPQGLKGENGATGFTETLPAGKTLKGEWTLSYKAPSTAFYNTTSVGFNIPLSESPAAHLLNERQMELTPTGEQVSTACKGTVLAPTAEPGNLCVYVGEGGSGENNLSTVQGANEAFNGHGWKWPLAVSDLSLPSPEPPNTASAFGFGIRAVSTEELQEHLQGSWAVTAE